MLAQFGLKVAVEVLFTPITYKIVGALKRAENEDYYDRGTNFSPVHAEDIISRPCCGRVPRPGAGVEADPRRALSKPTAKPDFRLGELLTRAGLLPRARLDAALARQAQHNGKLGALLVELGLIEEAELYAVLALQSMLARRPRPRT